MEAHAGPDLEIGIMPEPGHRIAAGPRGRLADPDAVAAMMPAIMDKARLIDDSLPGGIDVSRRRAGLDRGYHGIEGLAHDAGDPGILITNGANMEQPAQWRVVA